jgi:hypothetical protein
MEGIFKMNFVSFAFFIDNLDKFYDENLISADNYREIAIVRVVVA